MPKHAPDPGDRGDRSTGCLILVLILVGIFALAAYASGRG